MAGAGSGGASAIAAPPVRVLVVFTPGPRPWWLAWLHPRIGHCFALVRHANRWIMLESLAHRIELRAFRVAPDFDLAAHYRRFGYTTIETAAAAAPKTLAPPLPFTCVEVVKRVIGLHSWRIVTPFQLFRHLKKNLENR